VAAIVPAMTTQSVTQTRPRGDLRAAIASARGSRWAPLPIILAATFMVVLDFFIVNVALPSMQTRLHASAGSVEWVVAGYSLTSAVLLIAASRLGDRFGRRRLFTLGLTVFTLASAGCGVAPSATLLVAARLVQGVGAAMLLPNVLALIGALYDGPDRLRALSAYGMVMGLAAVGGQLLGGALLAANPAGLGWRTVFLINLPIGAVALTLARALVPESRAPRSGRVDIPGTALATAGVTAIVLPLIEAQPPQAHGWPLWTWVSFGAAPLLVAGFVAQQRRLAAAGGDPLLEPGMFAARAFTAGLAAQLVFWCGQASFFLVLALYLQQGRGLSALHSGLVFTILAVAYLATSMRAPALTAVHGRRVLAIGALSLAAGQLPAGGAAPRRAGATDPQPARVEGPSRPPAAARGTGDRRPAAGGAARGAARLPGRAGPAGPRRPGADGGAAAGPRRAGAAAVVHLDRDDVRDRDRGDRLRTVAGGVLPGRSRHRRLAVARGLSPRRDAAGDSPLSGGERPAPGPGSASRRRPD
jgi:MFS family permease